MTDIMSAYEKTSELVVVYEKASYTLADQDSPMPCLPGIISAELLQLLWIWKVERDAPRAASLFEQSQGHLVFLRTISWARVLQLGFGLVFAAGQTMCGLVSSPPESEDDVEHARRHHSSWPGSTTSSATVFKQYHVLTGFDYRQCVDRFVGFRSGDSPKACRGPNTGGRASRQSRRAPRRGALWPHRQFATLAARQPWACGAACRQASAFAHVAQAVLLQGGEPTGSLALGARRGSWALSEDQEQLLEVAQAELLLSEPTYWSANGVLQVQQSCSLARAFPVWLLLARLAGIRATELVREGAEHIQRELPLPTQPPPSRLAAFCDMIDTWPPTQRLTAQGALATYFLVKTVGGLLDTFGVRWWASAGALLGAVRNGGILPQDCDVDIAIWRPDAHQLVKPAFRAALAAAGVVSYHMPIYFQFRFCLAQVPAAADRRSVDGGLACYLPYVDGHLADVVPHEPDRWHYIHRTDLQYAHSFPLSGIFRRSSGGALSDARQRLPFGSYFEVWAPQAAAAELYLTTVYGGDWQRVLRGRRDNELLHNATEVGSKKAFYGSIARPTGPLRDVLAELTAFGSLEPGAEVSAALD
ncbi:unnamed protein product [Polarella glacialis]|nr:unnamed protein product [Polarella glacialis]